MSDPDWRTNPEIQQARRVAKELGATAVIMLVLDENAGTVRLATYGTTGPRCTRAGNLGEAAFDAVMTALSEPRRAPRNRRPAAAR